jgi:hypothetical protein
MMQMQVFSAEREYLIAAADELEEYLLSAAATWRIAGPESFPPLTPGNILLTKRRLEGLNDAVGEQEQIKNALEKIEKVQLRWNSAWKKRVRQEIPQRLRLWSNYLEDLIQTRNLTHQEFGWNVRWRVILALLAAEVVGPDQDASRQLNILDERLRAVTQPGPFVWEKGLESAFDRSYFWFLYLHISDSS